jgi:ubiquinone/menaquinone biosynthesis C-methylase UbiE
MCLQSIREHYEKRYRFSEESIELDKANLRDRLRWHQIALELVDSNGLLLDVGCGGGAVLRLLKRKSVGIDVSSRVLRLLHRSFKKEGLDFAELLAADAQHLPFRDQAFGVTVCSEALEHLPRPEIAVREIANATRLEVLITLPNMFELEAVQASGIRVHDLYSRVFSCLHGGQESPLRRFYFEHLTRGTIPKWRNFLLSNGLFCDRIRSICLVPYFPLLEKALESTMYRSRFVGYVSLVLDRLLGGIFPFTFLGQYTMFQCRKKEVAK